MAVKTETRQFRMHPKLLMDVIRRQAGSIEKAVLEGVQNAADAILCTPGRTDGYCKVEITNDTVTVQDNGRGIQTREEIEQFFETFGQPHDESEGKTYGTFRMGRGQMFAFGVNTWQTGPFVMTVDVANKGLDYHLKKADRRVGCKVVIRLYNALTDYQVNEVVREITRWVKYMPIRVTVNDKHVTVDPGEEEWTVVTPEAYMRFEDKASSLSVYNLGVHVLDTYGRRYGTGGIVVSRKQLKVNFARNDIQDDCEVWQPIRKEMKKFIDNQARNEKKPLTDDMVSSLLRRFGSGEVIPGLGKMELFRDTNGKRYSFESIDRNAYRFGDRISFAEKGDQRADRMLGNKSCLVLDQKCLDELNTDGTRFKDLLLKALGYKESRLDVKDFHDLVADVSDDCQILRPDELTEMEKFWLDLLDRTQSYLFVGRDYKDRRHAQRRLVVGTSDIANGWTDGSTYVAFNRLYLAERTPNVAGLADLIGLLVHELCHDTNTHGTHAHGLEFYTAYHDMSRAAFGVAIDQAVRRLPKMVPLLSKKMKRYHDDEKKRLTHTYTKLVEDLSDLRDSLKEVAQDTPAEVD